MRIYFDSKTRKKLEDRQAQLKKNKSSADLSPNEDVGSSEVPNTSSGDRAKETVAMTEVSLFKERGHESAHPLPHHHHHLHALNTHDTLTKTLPVRKEEIAPVAWMIIIGDGLHNFIDGLSIGAAFSESIVLGMSTSVAVIFEEFPHELGDFAVLISAGMTVRQALGFNFLSACTCYVGMICGILLGDMTQSASFIFALAGGMFLYISLVDMMGELSAMLEESKDSPRDASHLLLMQNIGILSGIIIIFILSMVSNG